MLSQGGKHLQGGNDPVTGRVPVKTEQMTGILTTEQPPTLAQHFEDIAVAHRSARERHTQFCQRVLEGKIGHQCPHYASHRPLAQTISDHGKKELVAIVYYSGRIDQYHPVSIAIGDEQPAKEPLVYARVEKDKVEKY